MRPGGLRKKSVSRSVKAGLQIPIGRRLQFPSTATCFGHGGPTAYDSAAARWTVHRLLRSAFKRGDSASSSSEDTRDSDSLLAEHMIDCALLNSALLLIYLQSLFCIQFRK